MSLSIIKYPVSGGGGGGDMAIGGAVTSGTPGSVLFIGAGGTLAQDNSNLFYDDTQNALGVGKNTLNAKFSIHDAVTNNYVSISAPDTSMPDDPDLFPVTIQYYLKQIDGDWAGSVVTNQGLSLECTSIWNGTDPVPGLLQILMPSRIITNTADFLTSLTVSGFIGADITGEDTAIRATSVQTALILVAPTGIVFGGTMNTAMTSSFGQLNTLFDISCESGGVITAASGTGLILEGYGGTAGVEARSYVTGNPAVLGIKQSSTGSGIDPVATFRGLTNFVVQNNSGLYLNLQPALPGAQVVDALRMTAKWTNLASPTSEIQFAARNANVDTQVLTIQGNANGRVGIGSTVTAPTARLHLPAGTATAQTAPLKFTSGTNLTTAEAGVMEYNGTNLFFTRTAANRETIITSSAVTTENVVSDTTITVNINGTNYKLLAVPV